MKDIVLALMAKNNLLLLDRILHLLDPWQQTCPKSQGKVVNQPTLPAGTSTTRFLTTTQVTNCQTTSLCPRASTTTTSKVTRTRTKTSLRPMDTNKAIQQHTLSRRSNIMNIIKMDNLFLDMRSTSETTILKDTLGMLLNWAANKMAMLTIFKEIHMKMKGINIKTKRAIPIDMLRKVIRHKTIIKEKVSMKTNNCNIQSIKTMLNTMFHGTHKFWLISKQMFTRTDRFIYTQFAYFTS